jgi:hypothetical protein
VKTHNERLHSIMLLSKTRPTYVNVILGGEKLIGKFQIGFLPSFGGKGVDLIFPSNYYIMPED